MKNNYYELAEQSRKLYSEVKNVKKVAKTLGFSNSKTRKLLVTSGIIFSKKHENILSLYNRGLNLNEIAEITGLAISSIDEYLPYKESLISEDKKTKKTKQNNLSKLRKDALKNHNDTKGILFAYDGCKGFNYRYFEDGIVIGENKYSFDSDEAKEMVLYIIDKKSRRYEK